MTEKRENCWSEPRLYTCLLFQTFGLLASCLCQAHPQALARLGCFSRFGSYVCRSVFQTFEGLLKSQYLHFVASRQRLSELGVPWHPRPILGRDLASNIRSQDGENTIVCLLRHKLLLCLLP